MTRFLTVGAAQMGPIAQPRRAATWSSADRASARGQAHGRGLVVFPELALTTFFPRWLIEDEAELDGFFEKEMPSHETAPLFDEAKALGLGFYLGYAELVDEDGRRRRFNTSIIVDRDGASSASTARSTCPATPSRSRGARSSISRSATSSPAISASRSWRAFGGVMGMCICNDRRWPETYRVMGLQGVEMVHARLQHAAATTPRRRPIIDSLTGFHNHLSMQAGAYQNATWVVGTAKGGTEEGSPCWSTA